MAIDFFELRSGREHSKRNTTKNNTLKPQTRENRTFIGFLPHTFANARFGQFIGAASA
jgi:hypothetical protein